MSVETHRTAAPSAEPAASPLHRAAQHESGLKHTSGEALYVDDLPNPPGMLVGLVVASPHAHARIKKLEVSAARKADGVLGVFTASEVPGENQVGPVIHDEPLFAADEVHTLGFF